MFPASIKKILGLLVNLSISLLVLILVFILLEVGLMIYQQNQEPPTENIPLYIPVDKPYLYQMNPRHERVNSYGLRDTEFSRQKPPDTFRILVLGDSLPYGRAVRSAMTFPNQLEAQLLAQGKKVEVINAGVSGYSPYNELQYYLAEGRTFDPDLVIVAFCMNDVANPRLHWGYTQEKITDIPDAAIPNLRYDREIIQPLLQERRNSLARKLGDTQNFITAISKKTRTYQWLASRLAVLFPDQATEALQQHQPDLDKNLPTYITAEDNLSIEVLTQPDSAEWLWLQNMYDQIHQATRHDRIPLLIAFFPLAYQLDDTYPYYPQKLFAQYCQQRQMACVDMLDTFRQGGKEKVFMLDKVRGYDVWHLTLDGHGITAQTLAAEIQQRGYLPR